MQKEFIADGLFYRQHSFDLPLDHQQPQSTRINVFAREVVDLAKDQTELPWLVYFQGGPGFPSPRPDACSGWLKRALKEYRVLLLDQRGTGLSTPLTLQTLSHLSSDAQVELIQHFRADNIVRDAEAIRDRLGIDKWSILGQSFGGFCALTYLSFFADSLERVFITGGIPSLTRHTDDVYRATYQRVIDKNDAFFAQFPAAQKMCQDIADFLSVNDVALPNGQTFTVEQFQQIGINLGRSGANLPMYYLLEDAFVDTHEGMVLSHAFLLAMLNEQSYQTNPIYAFLHEPIYNQIASSNWSAHRVRNTAFTQFNYEKGKPFLFTGEMVYPWMFDQMACLVPLKDAANMLATKQDWPTLYDSNALANNKVPVACAVYADDMYVEMDYSRETLRGLANSRAWITNEYEHNGLRADGEKILDRLISMADDIAQRPENR
ncbi:alpha/beta fold hydrolase [Enterovibrio nigricans]|uniref:Alpha/beta hydrolase fold n=1 Tax=Enterovibrio nigricans DSM 22720 TaxID=1121868 RepID=A0A1T4VU55_9GAMM|nr:alpha/beta fold hydrolase [Enterovibrio nigricans]PKF49411.1 alpha/beta hydrolase [Enterovibrio nigricans]SKA68544.1 alpha/beta hydrolase fold [Enterovibrio nigricans DSM 22720]